MANVITYPALEDDGELAMAVAAYLDAKRAKENAESVRKARQTQIMDYMGMASKKELENGVTVSVSAPVIKRSFDTQRFKKEQFDTYKQYLKESTESPRMTITYGKKNDEDGDE